MMAVDEVTSIMVVVVVVLLLLWCVLYCWFCCCGVYCIAAGFRGDDGLFVAIWHTWWQCFVLTDVNENDGKDGIQTRLFGDL